MNGVSRDVRDLEACHPVDNADKDEGVDGDEANLHNGL